jgi:MFS transporter, DHA2 family, multidrug resistance protein
MIAPSRQFFAGMILAVSNFMIVLDLTVANVSVPHIAGNLGITLDQGTWIITSYAVAEAVCVPLTGWLAARFGVVRMFVFAMLGFGLFSLLCGMSVTIGMLVACRIGQGICGAPIMPMSQTLMLRVFPPEKRAAAIGVWAMTTLLGPAMGPILGGWISDSFTWHWIFLINVPIAAACVGFGWFLLRDVESATKQAPIDKFGMILLVLWIGALQLMLDIGREHDWFGDWKIVALAIVAVIGFLAFVIWELTEKHPAVDLRIFRHRGFTFGVLTLAFSFGSYFASIVVIPQWLQSSLGYSATDAGILTAMTAFSALSTAPLVAKLMTKIDARILVSSGVLWLALMTLVRAGWTTGIDFWAMAVPQILQGFAMPFFIVPLTSLSLSAVPQDETATAAGLQNFVRTMAIAISTSLALTVWGNAQRAAQTDVASALNPGETLDRLNRVGMGMEQSRQIIAGIANNEATMLAVNHTFIVTAIVLFGAAALVWLSPRTTGTADLAQIH